MKVLQEYRPSVQKAEMHEALNSLIGILAGIVLDGQLTDADRDEMQNWYFLYASLLDKNLLNEIISTVRSILFDGVLDIEDVEHVLWVCRQITLAGDKLYIK